MEKMSSSTASKTWTEKQTKEVMRKVIRRAEVSRIARLLQHRLALANFKTKKGWENLTLDTIEPKIEEDLKRKRQRPSSGDKSPSPGASLFSESELEWLRKNKPINGQPHKRRGSQSSDIGPLPNFRNSKKRGRPSTSTDFQQPPSKRRQSWRDHNRTVQSSPGYRYGNEERDKDDYEFQPAFHSSPPRTPPRRIAKPGTKQGGEVGADLLIYLATSPSPAGAMSKTNIAPTTPPPSFALPSSVMNTPGGGPPRTPQTGFNFADFVNITPSPAQCAFGSVVAGRGTPVKGRGTPIAAARRRLNFDQLAPPTGSPSVPSGGTRHTGLGMELGGELVS
ncbi:uncharacterized protein H6S33_013057 [Morchella sextelata]|uniref:uncharacterized protein n=1 Tax=Morchella sextelata TaxID=1174677 RepID=UPI001D056823|nr:uncharacterized protein H6S33_013057 [Morchella sextelata]KAH0609571.1 hypothetical protein H6S33_013057 [Morchella sextelata]